GIPLSEGISAAAGIVNLRYKSCPEMEGQDHLSERIPAAASIVNFSYKSCPEMAGQDQSEDL
ncbi:hypothetical protein L8Q94_22190, partial [Enterobacter kobei]|uniref:hypothetical protein n=1 Tax=Enterobacter kobei TaxID=208224 RepID=UPI0020060B56